MWIFKRTPTHFHHRNQKIRFKSKSQKLKKQSHLSNLKLLSQRWQKKKDRRDFSVKLRNEGRCLNKEIKMLFFNTTSRYPNVRTRVRIETHQLWTIRVKNLRFTNKCRNKNNYLHHEDKSIDRQALTWDQGRSCILLILSETLSLFTHLLWETILKSMIWRGLLNHKLRKLCKF